MKSRILIFIHALILGAVFISMVGHDAHAQRAPEPDASLVRDEIQNVEIRWQMVWEAARSTNDSEVRTLLSHAQRTIVSARNSFSRGHGLRARAYARSAATLIERARQRLIQIGRTGTPQQVEQILLEAEQILERLARDSDDSYRIRQIRRLLERSRGLQAEGRSENAVRYALMAREQGQRAWQETVQFQAYTRRSEVLESVVGPLVERAEELAASSDDETLRRLADRSREHFETAQRINEEENSRQKARLFEAAMRGAERVIRELDREGFARRQAEQQIAGADAALARAAEVKADDDEQAAGLLEQGRSLLTQARERLTEGDYRAATSMASSARALAQRIVRQSLGTIDAERVQTAIDQTETLLAQTTSLTDEGAARLAAQAREHQTEARSLLADGNLRRALAETRVAARLAQRALNTSSR